MIAARRIDWDTLVGALAAIEPTETEVVEHAPALALGYNDPQNAALLGHTAELSADDVIEHYRDLDKTGARQFHLHVDGALVGDADLRGIREGAAEIAFLIAAPSRQGRGLGTRFALMLCGFGFAHLGLHRIYASLVPTNTASRRVFEKLGFTLDPRAEARTYADEPDDLVFGVERNAFVHRNAAMLAEVRVSSRSRT